MSYEGYRIELNRFGINNQGKQPAETTSGINAALQWAKSEGYTHVVLPAGRYLVRMNPDTLVAIQMLSGLHLELAEGCIITMEQNTSPNYAIIEMNGINHAKLSGGTLIGDKKTHAYEINVKFQRGGVNSDGSLNNNSDWIRSEVIDRYEHPGLLANFRVWSMNGVNASGYQFYQYKDRISKESLAGYRTNGAFAPASPTGRGWFLDDTKDNNKMIIAIKPSAPLTDAQIATLTAKIDNTYYTHEGGHGVSLRGSNHIEISCMEIMDCVGDGIFTTWEQYYIDPKMYQQEQMGSHVNIVDCVIHNCRRQGISICGTNDVSIARNHIYGIGYADDGKTTDFRNGTPPMFGIDIESMVGETNIPVLSSENPNGFELNYRIHISNNYVYNNARGHFINSDGTYVTLENNTFEGSNVGGIGSNPKYKHVKFIENTFIGCELWVQGDQLVHGASVQDGNVRLLEVQGAVVENCRIQNGSLYGSATYGYFGTPTVNVAASTFTFAAAHRMGNGAKVSFEQWAGKIPGGLSADKLYYTVNISANSFQVSDSPGGAPVKLNDGGQAGFNVSRYDYGRCYLSNIVVERDWRPDNRQTPNVNLIGSGMVIRNLTVKNYDATILVPQDYAGRPNDLSNITVIEGSLRLEGSTLSGGTFIKAKSNVIGRNEIGMGSTSDKFNRQVIIKDSIFQNVGIYMDGNSLLSNGTLSNTTVSKANNSKQAVIASSYFKQSQVNMYWVRIDKSATFVNNVFDETVVTGTAPYVQLVNNTVIDTKG